MKNLIHWIAMSWALVMLSGCVHALERREVTFGYVVGEAEALAQRTYDPPTRPLPDRFRNMGYDEYRDIRFVPQRALWAMEGLPFTVQIFHRGYLFQDPVLLREYSATHVQDIPYVQDFFEFGQLGIDSFPTRHAAYAGWRLHAPLNRPDYHDEVISFLGASYFRALGKSNQYGISARGLLIPHAPDEREEFPHFTHFWLGKPTPEAESMTALALLDSLSIAGAYAFTITPGDPTRVDVTARLFPRGEATEVGLAPLTSMFYYGEHTHPKPADFRPEVHDSDGLSIAYANGTALWRPLDVGTGARVQHFETENMKQFGLMQRDRDFQNYLDTESHYHRRPSVLVIPNEPFPPGKIVLKELPPSGEFEDNIVVYFLPDEPLNPDESIELHYTLLWGTLNPDDVLARVTQTRYGADIRFTSDYVFLVDFAPPAGGFPDDVAANIDLPPGLSVRTHSIETEPTSGHVHLRLTLTADENASAPASVQATLHSDGRTISETWSYQWNP